MLNQYIQYISKPWATLYSNEAVVCKSCLLGVLSDAIVKQSLHSRNDGLHGGVNLWLTKIYKNQETPPCTQWLVRVSTHHIQFWPLHLNCCGVSLWWSYKRLHCSWRPKPASQGGANPPLIRTHPMEFIQTEVRSPSHARTTKLSSCHQMSRHSSCTRSHHHKKRVVLSSSNPFQGFIRVLPKWQSNVRLDFAPYQNCHSFFAKHDSNNPSDIIGHVPSRPFSEALSQCRALEIENFNVKTAFRIKHLQKHCEWTGWSYSDAFFMEKKHLDSVVFGCVWNLAVSRFILTML